MSPAQPITSVRVCLIAMITQLALCMTAGAQSPVSNAHPMPRLMDREKEINLALSACPPAVAKTAGVYVLTRSGYEKVRDSQNGERSTTRVQLEMPPQAMERLQRLKERTEAASYAEVIRSALRLFEALVDEHEKGSEFALKRASGETLAYKIFV